jgi:hypothetical protein
MTLNSTLAKTVDVPGRDWRRQCVAATAAVALGVGTTTSIRAQSAAGQTAGSSTAPYAEIQFGTLTGSDNVINIALLPVVKSNGSIVYENVTIPLTVNESGAGAITLSAGDVTTVTAPLPITNGIKAGNYTGPGGGKAQLITVTGPSQVPPGGATEWAINQTPGATGCTWPKTAMVYVGPLTSNPWYPRLKAAGILSSAFSYGIMGDQPCVDDPWWQTGAVIGVSQTGDALNIVSFTHNGTDHAQSGDQITYSLTN